MSRKPLLRYDEPVSNESTPPDAAITFCSQRISFRDVNFSVDLKGGKTLTILKNVSGEFDQWKMTAIMVCL